MHFISLLYAIGVLCAALSTSFSTNSAVSSSTATIATTEETSHIHNNNFLKEKPKYLQTCQRKAADFDKCIVNAYQHIFSTWKDGIDGIKHSEPIDPLFVHEFEVIEDRENITPVAVKIQNITVTGLSEAKVKSVTFKDNEYDFKMTYFVPKVRLSGHYTAQGQVLLLKIDTAGEMFMEILDGIYTVSTKVKLHDLEHRKFFDLKSLQFNVDAIQDLHLHFANLFKDKVLNDNTNAVFNGSWRVFFDIFKPKIEAEINKVLLAHFRSVFGQVPAEFFIADVATAATTATESTAAATHNADTHNNDNHMHMHSTHASINAHVKDNKSN